MAEKYNMDLIERTIQQSQFKKATESAGERALRTELANYLLLEKGRYESAGIPFTSPVNHEGLSIAKFVHQKTMESMMKRIAALEKQVNGMQKKVDHTEKHALTFRGDWQLAQDYPAGAIVRHKGTLFTSLRDINPGKAPPDRQGSGWELFV